ncbi:hypothetical protein C8F01DRAFT_1137927 [Mycena amicta]|nr:hypothetical protein C8F01DRAFT_1137927 [Mycena amicta]
MDVDEHQWDDDDDDDELEATPLPHSSGTSSESCLRNRFPKHVRESHTTLELFNWLQSDRIDLDAEYQREFVWQLVSQMSFIDSVLRNAPVNQIMFVKYQDNGRERLRCVDGKQRLTSLLKFMNGEIPFRNSENKKSYWWIAHKSGFLLPDYDRREFESAVLSCVIFDKLSPQDERDIFERVQRGRPLNKAEKLRAIDSPRTRFALALERAFLVNPHSPLHTGVFRTTCKRSVPYRSLLQVIGAVALGSLGSMANGPEKWVSDKVDVPGGLEHQMRETLELCELVHSRTDALKLLAPAEFVACGVLVQRHRTSTTFPRLVAGLQRVTREVRAKYPKEVKMNAHVFATMDASTAAWALEANFINVAEGEISAMEELRRSKAPSLSETAGNKRKREDDEDETNNDVDVQILDGPPPTSSNPAKKAKIETDDDFVMFDEPPPTSVVPSTSTSKPIPPLGNSPVDSKPLPNLAVSQGTSLDASSSPETTNYTISTATNPYTPLPRPPPAPNTLTGFGRYATNVNASAGPSNPNPAPNTLTGFARYATNVNASAGPSNPIPNQTPAHVQSGNVVGKPEVGRVPGLSGWATHIGTGTTSANAAARVTSPGVARPPSQPQQSVDVDRRMIIQTAPGPVTNQAVPAVPPTSNPNHPVRPISYSMEIVQEILARMRTIQAASPTARPSSQLTAAGQIKAVANLAVRPSSSSTHAVPRPSSAAAVSHIGTSQALAASMAMSHAGSGMIHQQSPSQTHPQQPKLQYPYSAQVQQPQRPPIQQQSQQLQIPLPEMFAQLSAEMQATVIAHPQLPSQYARAFLLGMTTDDRHRLVSSLPEPVQRRLFGQGVEFKAPAEQEQERARQQQQQEAFARVQRRQWQERQEKEMREREREQETVQQEKELQWLEQEQQRREWEQHRAREKQYLSTQQRPHIPTPAPLPAQVQSRTLSLPPVQASSGVANLPIRSSSQIDAARVLAAAMSTRADEHRSASEQIPVHTIQSTPTQSVVVVTEKAATSTLVSLSAELLPARTSPGLHAGITEATEATGILSDAEAPSTSGAEQETTETRPDSPTTKTLAPIPARDPSLASSPSSAPTPPPPFKFKKEEEHEEKPVLFSPTGLLGISNTPSRGPPEGAGLPLDTTQKGSNVMVVNRDPEGDSRGEGTPLPVKIEVESRMVIPGRPIYPTPSVSVTETQSSSSPRKNMVRGKKGKGPPGRRGE